MSLLLFWWWRFSLGGRLVGGGNGWLHLAFLLEEPSWGLLVCQAQQLLWHS